MVTSADETDDLIVIGAGAAGLMAAIVAARVDARLRIRAVDGARHIGAKILVSGGSRCNVTNRQVSERDFWGGSSRIVRGVLRAFPADRAAAFFESLGVPLHEEEDGKLFPDSNRSRSVLDALLREASTRGVRIESGTRVTDVRRDEDGFTVIAGERRLRAKAIVLATGGKSLPKTGSDGFGYELARRLGHTCVPTTPALAPLLLEGTPHAALSGIAHRAAIALRVDGRVVQRLEESWLWTHFGASGPLALNTSRHWHRAMLDAASASRETVLVELSLFPGKPFDAVEAWLLEEERGRPRAQVSTVLAAHLPAAVAETWVRLAGIAEGRTLAHLSRDDRRRLVRALTEFPLSVTGSRGYTHAEVTAGGVPLEELDPSTLESRCCAGLYFAGEILDVDGRLGGFNFQWAWSSGWTVGHASAKRLAELRRIDAEV